MFKFQIALVGNHDLLEGNENLTGWRVKDKT